MRRNIKKQMPDVYSNEDLTCKRSKLLFEARKCKRAKKISDCWSVDGYVMVKDPQQALTLGLWVQWPGGPVDLKTYWPPKKLTGPGGQ